MENPAKTTSNQTHWISEHPSLRKTWFTMLSFAYIKVVISPVPRAILVTCCITSFTPRIKMYERLFCNPLKRYLNSEKALRWSPGSMLVTSGCLASLWEWLHNWLCTHPWEQLWSPDLTVISLELRFSAHSLGMEFIWIWTSPE